MAFRSKLVELRGLSILTEYKAEKSLLQESSLKTYRYGYGMDRNVPTKRWDSGNKYFLAVE